ncbi:MAG: amidohydrolase family protein, partial [Oscillospiraceae bacterium]
MEKNKRIDLLNCIKNNLSTLIIKNAKVVDVFTEQIINGDIAIYGDTILGVGSFSGDNEIDANGKFVVPGFIDSHLHIESSMTTPRNYAQVVIPHGTTTIIADPHEIANVLGNTGIEFLLDQSDDVFLHIYMMLPSCVPCSPFEHNGCTLLSKDMEELISHPRVIGLGEVMDYVSLTNGEATMMDKIDLFKNNTIDGHAPSLFGKTLDAYAIGGPTTDHECSTYDEVIDRLSRGLKVLIRMGSAANDVEDIFKKISQNNLPTENILLCTDDKHLEDLKNQGHIDYILKTAVKCGISPIKAIKMATINSALTYKLERKGAIAPGYVADLVFVDNLEDFSVEKVIIDGKLMDKNIDISPIPYKQKVTSAVNIAPLPDDAFKIKVTDKMPIIGVVDGQIITKLTYENVPTV